MSDITTPLAVPPPSLASAVLNLVLPELRYGKLICVLPGGQRVERHGTLPGPLGVLEVYDTRLGLALALQGADGLDESYLDGAWGSPNLTALLTLLAQNFTSQMPSGMLALPSRLLSRLRHAANANTRSGARRNIMAHYDLGNEFYAAWLDEMMLYSSALYVDEDEPLETAQARRLGLIADWLDAPKGANVLEIGCGWGALARYLGEAGALVTGLTLSPAQLGHAQRIAGDNVALALRDYREETGLYDRIVSIEMLEAVGEAYWPAYFATLRARLKHGGKAVLQVITIDAARYASYRRAPDFIQRHIFPGGMLPSKAEIGIQARRAGLTQARTLHFGASYARTLAEWRTRFLAAWPCLAEMGFDQRFKRLWTYYLSYCEAGFATGAIDVGLYELKG
ncbi:MAG: cyclopropane-fatty-acyl-phospholipid synthase family protein [Proteobacteria bacterium]|nr:cyclopropane-fatty-acyl-phospholipid synthase family protein [Pseudomonadota bacterium]MBU6424888.1 cyclopropane-fatty-acyl-phospholipid synthase family protein [Rhodospirillales bacterium]